MMKMKNSKRWLALILTVAMMCASMSMAVFAEPEGEGSGTQPETIEYYDENGFVKTAYCTVVEDAADENGNIVLSDGWYVINNGNNIIDLDHRIRIEGTVHLIISNSVPCFLNKGIEVPETSSLSIYDACGGTPNILYTVKDQVEEGNAAMGGNAGEPNGEICIYGGEIVLIGKQSSGIGRGKDADVSKCKDLTITGGNLTANGDSAQGIDVGNAQFLHPGMTIGGSGSHYEAKPCSHTDNDSDNKCDECGVAMNYIVTFDSKCGTVVAPQTVPYNGTVTMPDPETMKNPGYLFEGWTCDGETYEFGSLVRSERTLEAVWTEGKYARADSATVIYDGGLKLRFTLYFSESLLADSDGYIIFSKAGQEIEKDFMADLASSGQTQFSFPVQAMEWQDEFEIEVFDGEDNQVEFFNAKYQEYEEDTLVYSVYKHYLDRDSFPEEYKSFLENAVYYYCGNAQIYFGYNVDTMQGENYACPNFSVDSDYRMSTSGPRPSWLTKTSLRVKFTEDNTLRVTFTLTEDSIANYSFVLKDCEGTVVSTEATRVGAKRYALDAENISAPNLTKNYTFTITNTTSNESYTITASAMSYAIMAIEKGTTEQMRELGKALYLYGEEADTYFANA